MWNKTKATALLDIQYPIIQGPFGGRFSSSKLVSAVSNSGGLGSFGLHAYGPEEIREINIEIQRLTDKPYALNLWVPVAPDPAEHFSIQDFEALREKFKPFFDQLSIPLPDMPVWESINFSRQVEAILEAVPPVASFIFGVPDKDIISALKRQRIITIATATSVEEAMAIEEAGIELVVASGMEAGGHRASFLEPPERSLTSTFALVSDTVKKVKIPVIAAGGVADASAMVRMLRAGASAVQIGTAFLATDESNASEDHKALLLNRHFETALTKVYTGRLARAIINNFSQRFGLEEELAPYPIQSAFLSTLRQAAMAQNRQDFLAFWAGQPSTVLQHRSAVALMSSLVTEVSNVYERDQ